MRPVLNITRFIVGLLFIFSGLVKANDPLGLSYKMQEFFEIWDESLSKSSFFIKNLLIHFFWFLHEHSLALSVLIISFEIIAGVAVLLGWKMKLFSWLLLVLIIFFTFLTGYAYYSGKFKNCGCFGDCLPISPLVSFLKDLGLTVLILFIFSQRKKIIPAFPGKINAGIMGITTLFSFGIQLYVLNYLPLVDCLPFKEGNNIQQKMKIPPGAIPDSFAIRFIYEKEGKQFEFSPAELPADLGSYKFKDRKDKLIRKGNAEPAIKGFSLSGITNEDSTGIILSKPYCILLFCENFSTPVSKWEKSFSGIYSEAKNKNIPLYLVTTTPEEALKVVRPTSFADIPVLKCDYTAIRTAARANPCLYFIENGIIKDKWSYKNMNQVKENLKRIPVQQTMP